MGTYSIKGGMTLLGTVCEILKIVITTAGTVLASSGIWNAINNKAEHRSSLNAMMIGLGHNKIIELCERYIVRGYITVDEYDDLTVHLYKPYKALGGNGTAEKLVNEVKKLPILPDKKENDKNQ